MLHIPAAAGGGGGGGVEGAAEAGLGAGAGGAGAGAAGELAGGVEDAVGTPSVSTFRRLPPTVTVSPSFAKNSRTVPESGELTVTSTWI
jgi:hypothetical protein